MISNLAKSWTCAKAAESLLLSNTWRWLLQGKPLTGSISSPSVCDFHKLAAVTNPWQTCSWYIQILKDFSVLGPLCGGQWRNNVSGTGQTLWSQRSSLWATTFSPVHWGQMTHPGSFPGLMWWSQESKECKESEHRNQYAGLCHLPPVYLTFAPTFTIYKM